jgi:hypothetical protein
MFKSAAYVQNVPKRGTISNPERTFLKKDLSPGPLSKNFYDYAVFPAP